MIVFLDPKSGRGGGQVVLEELLRLLSPSNDVGLAMPDAGRSSISIPGSVRQASSIAELVGDTNGPVTIVANANASFPTAARWAARLRRRGVAVRSVGIVHNYPSQVLKRLATVVSLRLLDTAIVVEPGLAKLRKDAVIPSWLSVPTGFPIDLDAPIEKTGVVKCYGRPDRSKGLHLLPAIFREIEAAGYDCRVALGTPLDDQDKYADRLRRDLSPWLEDGPRTNAWIEPGDVFLVPSISGEAACLSAQEAMAKGAFVVASRLGLMPYLWPEADGAHTFRVADASAAVSSLLAALASPRGLFEQEVKRAQRSVLARRGLWHEQVAASLGGSA